MKRAEAESLQEQRWWFNQDLRSSSPCCDEHWALILLLPSALASVCCHGKATLILIPVAFCWFCAQQTPEDAHTCTVNSTHEFLHAWNRWVTNIEHTMQHTQTSWCTLTHARTEQVHTSTVYHVQAWRTLSPELSLTWMEIHASTICQLTALHVGCMCNLDALQACVASRPILSLTQGMIV